MELPPSVSQLVERHLRYHVERWYKIEEARQKECKVPTLISLAADAVVQNLEEEDGEENIRVAIARMAEEFDFSELRHVLNSPKATYPLLRAFYDLKLGEGRRAIDLDDAIVRNERFLLERSNTDGKYLVSLEDFIRMLPDKTFIKPNVVSFARKDPPKGGYEVLDDMRKRNIQILANSVAFSQTFDRVTQGILQGLDWSNVILAGDMVLFTLLQTDPVHDEKESIRDIFLTIYIHGLDSDGANQKAEEIYETWNNNLPFSTERLLVKTTRTLTYRPSYPYRTVQIRLRLYPTPTDVLLSLDLDPCAVAYNGSSVFMLPRCARAIETGYTIFRNELIYGHHLSKSGRLATRPVRLFKYASRGFGLRFQPSFAKILQEDQCTEKEAASWSNYSSLEASCAEEQRDRYPFGSMEPGLLTLKRVAHLGQDYMHRLYYGPTLLTIHSHKDVYSDEKSWQQAIKERDLDLAELSVYNERARITGGRLRGPLINDETLMDTRDLLNPHMGFANFEIFSRTCEVWRRVSRKEAHFLNGEGLAIWIERTAELELDRRAARFSRSCSDPEVLADYYMFINDMFFEVMASAINTRLQTSREWNRSDFRDYLTRRIRTKVWGSDFQTIREKQITMPILISHELETFLVQILNEHVEHAPENFTPLLPVHDTAKYNAATSTLPTLRDVTGKARNFRYWVITSTSQWAGQSRVVDEVAEVLWGLHQVFDTISGESPTEKIDEPDPPDALQFLSREFSTRHPETLDEDRKDLLLFRQWVLSKAARVSYDPGRIKLFERDSHRVETLFAGEDIRYPFPNDYFWNEGDEGEWDNAEDGFPEWREPVERAGARNTPAEEFFDPNLLRSEKDSNGEEPSINGEGLYRWMA